MEGKAFEFSFEDGKLHIKADPNRDGEVLLELSIDLKEIPDEVIDAIQAVRGKK